MKYDVSPPRALFAYVFANCVLLIAATFALLMRGAALAGARVLCRA